MKQKSQPEMNGLILDLDRDEGLNVEKVDGRDLASKADDDRTKRFFGAEKFRNFLKRKLRFLRLLKRYDP